MKTHLFIDCIAYSLMCLFVCLFMAAPIAGHAEDIKAPEAQAVQQVINTLAPQETDDTLVSLAGILGVFGGPVCVLIVLIVQHYRSQMRLADFRREAIGKLIDAGKDVPESLLFFQDLNGSNQPHKNLQRALVNIGFGLGVLVFLWAVHSLAAGTFGLIFIGIGAAQFITWHLSRGTQLK
ncbi:MAG TPA: DUF6249 domain-containing protein [Cellvibrionaceae bacterium]|nr:DUF6249 domain-containing protein [Cellvibrionaceae bacterium]HMW46735.1 DUF6249 domain-containing protein [Cellvibrionaceae bacterium]HMW72328.1 DUF6249 domain-containing protein [Cellvibrionaceae bacterium]HMY40839.1 DUF6249 domain-containing protein [Marinagarivorans sp.]HNG58317.1 DUF6249 domain-containing protein [Cellvibrionaceae bacterium]